MLGCFSQLYTYLFLSFAMLKHTYPQVILFTYCGLFTLVSRPALASSSKQRPWNFQYLATSLAQEVEQGVIKTNYATG